MKRALAVIAALTMASTSALAQPARDDQRCPTRRSGENLTEFLMRTRPACEARWQSRVAAGAAAPESHNRFLERCGRRCAAYAGPVPTPYILGGLALLGAGVAVAASSSNDSPASP